MTSHPMMKCGHTAQGTMSARNGVKIDPPIPSCVICDCTEIASDAPSLAGRIAECSYLPKGHADVPSNPDLAFFEYRGPGSPRSTEICKCGYSIVAHEGGKNHGPSFRCRVGGFTPCGDTPDKYYCGCHGWE